MTSTAGLERFGAIDLGTHTCCLAIAELEGEGMRLLYRERAAPRLGEGLAHRDRLDPAAAERTLAVLDRFARLLRDHRVSRGRFLATEACRRARDGRAFLSRVRERTGLAFELIPPAEEARLAMLSVLPLLGPGFERTLLVDVGGGSIELALVRSRGRTADAQPFRVVSLRVGVVLLSELPGSDQEQLLEAELGRIPAALRSGGDLGLEVIVVSNTLLECARRLRQAGSGGVECSDHLCLEGADLEASTAALSASPQPWHGCREDGCARRLSAGLRVLRALVLGLRPARLVVADRGLHDGQLVAFSRCARQMPRAGSGS